MLKRTSAVTSYICLLDVLTKVVSQLDKANSPSAATSYTCLLSVLTKAVIQLDNDKLLLVTMAASTSAAVLL